VATRDLFRRFKKHQLSIGNDCGFRYSIGALLFVTAPVPGSDPPIPEQSTGIGSGHMNQ